MAGFVAVVSLNVEDPGAALCGHLAQVLDNGGGDAPSSMLCADHKVIDIQLAPRRLKLGQFVGDEPKTSSPASVTMATTSSFASRPLR